MPSTTFIMNHKHQRYSSSSSSSSLVNRISVFWLALSSRNRIAALVSVAFTVAFLLLSSASSLQSSTTEKHEDTSIPASVFESTPMCNSDGLCGEDPTQATPRTIYSAKTKEQYHLWWKTQKALREKAEQFELINDKLGASKPSLIFLGDSITESWLGTNMGQPEDRAKTIPQVFNDEFNENDYYKTLILAIGGDQVQHLLWRVQTEKGGGGGMELTESVRNDPNTTFIAMIGTNNIGSGILPGPTLKGLIHFIQYLLDRVRGRLLVLQLLPRGDNHRLANLCPPRCSDKEKGIPFKSFMPAIRKVNEGLIDAFKNNIKLSSTDRVELVDCGKDFEPASPGDASSEVNEGLMSDKLHPNAEGHKKLAACIKKFL